MTERDKATRARAELRGVAVLNLRALGIARPSEVQINAETYRLRKANEMAARGCLRELA